MYEPLPVYKPAASRVQIEKALEMLIQSERPVIVAGGGVINADAAPLLQQFAELINVPVIPTLMGWGCTGRSPLNGGDGRPANGAPLRQRHSAGIRYGFWHR